MKTLIGILLIFSGCSTISTQTSKVCEDYKGWDGKTLYVVAYSPDYGYFTEEVSATPEWKKFLGIPVECGENR